MPKCVPRSFTTGFGEVRKIRYSAVRSGRRYAALFVDGVAVYEADKTEAVASLSFGPTSAAGPSTSSTTTSYVLVRIVRAVSHRRSGSLWVRRLSRGRMGRSLNETSERVVDVDWINPDHPILCRPPPLPPLPRR